jgi:class 3 adenylate cyclase/CHASE2 domain-containing sensor protein
MKLTAKRIPAVIAASVILLVCGVSLLRLDVFERLEQMTFDMRSREALKFHPLTATNLGFVFIDESTVDFVRTNHELGYRFGLYWPRQIYGRLANELAQQGAKAIAFDVLFSELRPDHPPVRMADETFVDSDEFFAQQIRRAGNVILATTRDSNLPLLFRTNAFALGEISAEKDADGILRRARAFRLYRHWHPVFQQAQTDFGFQLPQSRIEPGRIVLRRPDHQQITVPLDQDGNFQLADFLGDKLPPGMPPKAKPYVDEKIWNLGIVLAARELQLDLGQADVDLRRGRIVLRGPGIERTIPVDREGYFYIDWCLPPNHPRLRQESAQMLLLQNRSRLDEKPSLPPSTRWREKLVVVGSAAIGDLTDRGPTPLRADTLLVSKHWNIANSLLTGRFVRRAPLPLELALIVLLGTIAGVVTWRIRVLQATGVVMILMLGYSLLVTTVYIRSRFWLPLVLPLAGALLMTYVCLVAWRVVFEQAEVRRIKSIFSKVVSPKIVKELLHAETLSVVGTRREVTVLFADIRGFTELTDHMQEQAAEFVRQNDLRGEAAEDCFDEQARETLATVNLYLGVVADIIIKQDGTWDKFIGDCVMAFWGAPTPNPKHAVACVRAAIEAQRTIYDLNLQRAAENKRRELENRARLSAGLRPKPILPLLLLGSGINTGMATAGLMGSQAEQKNYTVFGREVNLASRLENLSGHGRIFISQSTYVQLQRHDPALAATCIAQGQKNLKGIGSAVEVYEVPWRPAQASLPEPQLTEAPGLRTVPIMSTAPS